MKFQTRHLWLVVAVLLLVSLFAVAQAEPLSQTATATPAPKPATAPAAAPAVEIPFLADWQGSAHNDAKSEAFVHWDAADPKEVPASCAKCHSTPGYLDFLGADGSKAGSVEKGHPVGTTVTCVACHNTATINKTSVVFPSGVELKGLGDESRCMECHQGRESKVSVDAQIERFKVTNLDAVVAPIKDDKGADVAFGFRNVHYFAAAATQFGTLVKGGYEYEGQSYDGKFQHVEGFNTCATCHNPHTLEVNLDSCKTCHTDVKAQADLLKVRMNGSLMDYDGDGDAKEGVSAEMVGLQEKLLSAIKAYGKEVAKADIGYDAAVYPYFFTDANANGKLDAPAEKAYSTWTARLLKAAYNYQVATKDPGKFAHNAKYVIQLMHDSISDLNSKLAKPIDITKADRNDAGHFDGTKMAFRDWDETGVVPAGCAKCHSATGLPQFLANGGTVAVAGSNVVTTGTTGAEPANGFACATCHDDLTKFTVRSVTNVPFPSGKSVTFSTEKDDKGNLKPVAANLCLECHQGRQSTVAMNARTKGIEDDVVPEKKLSFQNVHYFAAGASLFGNDAQVGYQYADKEYVGRNAHVPGFDTCTSCHNTHELGLNMDKCVTCHAGVKAADEIRMSATDFDGDKNVKEGVAEEIATLEEKLFAAIKLYAKDVSKAAIVYDSGAYPYFFADANSNGKKDTDEKAYTEWTPRLLRAAYNYQYIQKDPGLFAHNPKYGVQLAFDALSDLGTKVKVDLTGAVRP